MDHFQLLWIIVAVVHNCHPSLWQPVNIQPSKHPNKQPTNNQSINQTNNQTNNQTK
jgi:hypothetical protein